MSDAEDRHAKWLISQARKGTMNRREFLGRTSALGIALTAGTALFGEAMAAAPKKGGTMRIGMGHGATTDTLNPATIENGIQWVAAYGVANTLVELAPDGKMMPERGRSSCAAMSSSRTADR